MLTKRRSIKTVMSYLLLFSLVISIGYSAPITVKASSTNLALNTTGSGYPTPSASYTSSYDDSVWKAVDGVISYLASPNKRWTSYGSGNATDWFAVDFGSIQTIGFAALYIYDDTGGVKAPESYNVQYWDGSDWVDARNQVKYPTAPIGGYRNDVEFTQVSTQKVRIVFTNKTGAYSGMTELGLYAERPVDMPLIDYDMQAEE